MDYLKWTDTTLGAANDRFMDVATYPLTIIERDDGTGTDGFARRKGLKIAVHSVEVLCRITGADPSSIWDEEEVGYPSTHFGVITPFLKNRLNIRLTLWQGTQGIDAASADGQQLVMTNQYGNVGSVVDLSLSHDDCVPSSSIGPGAKVEPSDWLVGSSLYAGCRAQTSAYPPGIDVQDNHTVSPLTLAMRHGWAEDRRMLPGDIGDSDYWAGRYTGLPAVTRFIKAIPKGRDWKILKRKSLHLHPKVATNMAVNDQTGMIISGGSWDGGVRYIDRTVSLVKRFRKPLIVSYDPRASDVETENQFFADQPMKNALYFTIQTDNPNWENAVSQDSNQGPRFMFDIKVNFTDA